MKGTLQVGFEPATNILAAAHFSVLFTASATIYLVCACYWYALDQLARPINSPNEHYFKGLKFRGKTLLVGFEPAKYSK